MKSALLLFGLLVGTLSAQENEPTSLNWPNWRGPSGNGTAAETAKPPVEWSETQNVKWKVPISGKGNSTPVIWGNQLFVLSAEPIKAAESIFEEEMLPVQRQRGGGGGAGGGGMMSRSAAVPTRLLVLCLAADTGKELWRKTAIETTPHAGTHGHNTYASSSAVTDGKVLIAHFGSLGTYAYDLEGKLLWKKDLGDMEKRGTFGEGGSAALHDGKVVVPWDHEGQSYLVCFDAQSGEQKWKVERNEGTGWSTPVIMDSETEAGPIVLINGHYTAGYQLNDGKLVWWTGGHTQNHVASPVLGDGVIYAASGARGGSYMLALPVKPGEGDVTEKCLYTRDSGAPHVPSLLYNDGCLYMTQSNSGIITCLDAKSGKPHYERERLEGVREIYSSPVAAAGHVYWVGRDGTTAVIKAGAKLEPVSVNKLEQEIDSSPVVIGNRIYLRGKTHLYCIEAQ